MRLTWVKGHATRKHIDDNITTEARMKGNHMADQVADIGTALHGELLISLAKTMQARYTAYQRFMIDLSQHIVEAYYIHRLLMNKYKEKEQQYQMHLNKKKPYHMLQYAQLSETKRLQNNSSIANHTNYQKRNPNANNIQSFLANLQVAEGSNHMRNITWLELYILYRIRGYPKPIPDKSTKASTRASAAKQRDEFKRQIVGVAKRTLHSSKQLELFKAAGTQNGVLLGVGILGKHPSPSFNIALNEEEIQTLAICLFSVNRTISNKNAIEHHKGKLDLEPHELNLKGRAEWDTRIPILKDDQQRAISWQPIPNTSNESTYISFYTCPNQHCRTNEISTRESFQLDDLDGNIKCSFCLHISNNNDWECVCHKKWYLCPEHREQSHAPKKNVKELANNNLPSHTGGQGNTQSERSVQRKLNYNKIHNHEDILNDDFRIVTNKRNADTSCKYDDLNNLVDLGIPRINPKRQKLGPILATRFGCNIP